MNSFKKNKRDSTFKVYINDGRLHHLWHAYSSYFNSGFNDRPVLSFVFDGTGSHIEINRRISNSYLKYDGTESNSVYIINGQNFTTLYKHISCATSIPDTKIEWQSNQHIFEEELKHPAIISDLNFVFNSNIPSTDIQPTTNLLLTNNVSLGKMYNAITMLLGFDEQEPGKTMGLSSYGDKKYDLLDDNLLPKKSYFSYVHSSPIGIHEMAYEPLSNQAKQDLAKSCQKDLERSIENTVLKYYNETKINDITISGGVALNVLNNANLRKKLPKHVNFWAEPLASDLGTSLGFAYYFNLINNIKNDNKKFIYSHAKPKINYDKFDISDESIDEIIQSLLNKKIVGVFSEFGEIGPRALGNRSLLLDPRAKNGKDLMNSFKKREYFRPFAGIMLKEYFLDWFDDIGLKESPYMMYGLSAKKDKERLIPSIIHEDGTCRIQTVDKDQNEHMYRLLCKWYDLTGVPILMNTSMNLSGMPIAETDGDLIEILKRDMIDFIWVPNKTIFLKEKNASL